MKIVQITLDGVSRYSTIEDTKFMGVHITKRATDFIRAQSIDNNVYYGRGNLVEDERLFVSHGTGTTNYYVKSEVWESPLVLKIGEWEWKEISLKIVEVMED